MPAIDKNRDQPTHAKRNRQRGKRRPNCQSAARKIIRGTEYDSAFYGTNDPNGAREIRHYHNGANSTVHAISGLVADEMVKDNGRELAKGALTILLDLRTGATRDMWYQWRKHNRCALCTQLTETVRVNGKVTEVCGMTDHKAEFEPGCEFWTVDCPDTFALSSLLAMRIEGTGNIHHAELVNDTIVVSRDTRLPLVRLVRLSHGEQVSRGAGAGEKPIKSSGKAKEKKPGAVSENMHYNHDHARIDALNSKTRHDYRSMPYWFIADGI